ncbi:hypothetical protein [Mammaliicoccus stepanovicii]|uniref:Uncharacterized protein n=1 Tax=Mammaliicoccus stepanovicii TaxID=643214 RepID=A0A239ZEE2_9STAP|nr:hypothetical protein [Mammaliicoccus stepanovicii]PNZ72866.1 hypothetical protein CD111_10235 [Mammaliicoccus stepanovicii]GGI41956.1 hypothetical protein GCM10010896_16010 [Mammaliicoccus stepanovicii]SNV69591.1 Uncharacterised protein [Mammaliicoccus stepanovicii]
MFFEKKIFVFEDLENKYNEEDAKNIFNRYKVDYGFITESSQSIILGGLKYNSKDDKEQFITEFNQFLGN